MSNANLFAPAAVAISGLRKSFGINEVLKGIDLNVQPGEVIAIIGKSGSGKSTLLRCINGLETFQHGRLTVQGHALDYSDPSAMRALRQQVGMIFQSFNLFPHLTVGKKHPTRTRSGQAAFCHGNRNPKRGSCSHEWVSRKSMTPFQTNFSGGQQQRVAIARALAMSPGILLCDEITSALDPELVGEVLAVVESLAKEGMTLLMVTHEMNFARKVSNRVIFMHQGLVHEQGTPDVLFTNPQTPELQQFLSSLH